MKWQHYVYMIEHTKIYDQTVQLRDVYVITNLKCLSYLIKLTFEFVNET